MPDEWGYSPVNTSRRIITLTTMSFACHFAITSMSLGRASHHHLIDKLDQAKQWGITGIELFYEDLEYIAKDLPGGLTSANEIEAAVIIRRLCDKLGLVVICIQPLWCDEGSRDENAGPARLQAASQKCEIARILGSTLILVPSTMSSSCLLSNDPEVIAHDLRQVAELGARCDPPINFAYESLCWGTHIDTWEACWDVVQRVDRSNFGICLDTFNIAGRVFADPTAVSGTTPDAYADLCVSIKSLVQTVAVEKVFLVQLVDGQRLDAPLLDGHDYHVAGQHARMSWSRNCRLFYGEKSLGAYLPVEEVAKAIFHDIGYCGWVSMELFNRSLSLPDINVPAAHAERAVNSWVKLVDDCKATQDWKVFLLT